MCISQCMQNDCHEHVYGGNELEPGEIDELRESSFETCVKNVLREEAAQKKILAKQ